MFEFHILLTINCNLKNLQLNKLKQLLSRLRGFKFVTKLVLVFKKIESKDKTWFDNFYSSAKAETTINKSNIGNAFKSIYTTTITNIKKCLEKSSGWIIDSVIDHTISIQSLNL